MKILAALPLCGVDLPNISKRNYECFFAIWGIHLHPDKKETGRKREREREMKEGKITKNYSLECRRDERQEPQKGSEF